MVDQDVDDDKGTGNALYIIDIQSGDVLQRIRIDLQDAVAAICVDGADEIFIAGWNASKVVVLRYAIRGVRGLTQEVIG